MRQLAPSGTPITLKELSFWLQTIPARQATMKEFSAAICTYFGVKYCYFLSTGRAAMALLLQSLAELAGPGRDTVIIPSYTCFSVPASIIKAGLKVRVSDVDPHTLDYDYEKLSKEDFSDVLAISSGNLYGIPNDLELLEQVARINNVFFIDDAAQAMGSRTVNGRLAGTFGDAGLFSLDKGKAITSMNGGIIVTNSSRIASGIESKIEHLPSPSPAWCMTEVAKMFVYALFLRPSLYWIPSALPFLKLGTTVYTTDYPLQKYNRLLGGLAYRLFEQLDEINRIRLENGEYYRKKMPETPNLRQVKIKPGAHPIYLRYPLLIPDKKLRENTVLALNKKGLGATTSFPASIIDIDQLKDKFAADENNAVGGRIVANEIVTLPTHPFVTRTDQDKILSTIQDIVP